jgi:DNA polymerase-3 subunit delta'
MSASDEPTAPDQEAGCTHPRLRRTLVGHEAEEAEMAAALAGPRCHHAWLVVGPKGVGKATLAYRVVRAALGASLVGPRPLDVAAEDPVARRIDALTHPDLFVLTRTMGDKGKAKREIAVADVREIGGFFALQPGMGGRRVAIVDALDDLNVQGANALLKTLEEPPPHALLILLAHNPGAALATIRSRCRRITLRSPGEGAVRALLEAEGAPTPGPLLLELAEGRPGRALALHASGAMKAQEALRRGLAAFGREGGQAVWPAALIRDAGGAAALPLLISQTQAWIRDAAAPAPGREERADPYLAQQMRTPDRAAAWAEAYAALGALLDEAERLDMDPVHAALRIAQILDQARSPAARTGA